MILQLGKQCRGVEEYDSQFESRRKEIMELDYNLYFGRFGKFIGILFLIFAYDIFTWEKWYYMIFVFISIILYVIIPALKNKEGIKK